MIDDILNKIKAKFKNEDLQNYNSVDLTWKQVKNLVVKYITPEFVDLGFMNPGNIMYRDRGEFIDVIQFRCGKYNDRVIVSFGCGFKKFTKHNPKPWDCIFDNQSSSICHHDYLKFCNSKDEQIRNFKKFVPIIIHEAKNWYELLKSPDSALRATKRNNQNSIKVGQFQVPSPAYEEIINQIESIQMHNQKI